MLAPLAIFAPFLDYFRPSRSPYLLSTIAAASFLCFLVQADVVKDWRSHLVFLPALIVLILMVLFSLIYRAVQKEFKSRSLIRGEIENYIDPIQHRDFIITLTDAISAKVGVSDNDDADGQFKFARAAGISGGVVVLYFLLFPFYVEADIFFWLTYLITVFQLLTFTWFLFLEFKSREDPRSIQIVQISITTMTLLIAISYSQQFASQFSQISEGRYLTLCDQTGTFEGLIDDTPFTQEATIKQEAISCGAPGDLKEKIFIDWMKAKPDTSESSTITITKQDMTQNSWLNYYSIVWLVFVSLWLLCELYWIRTLFNILSFRADK